MPKKYLHANLKTPSFGNIFDTFKGFEFFSIHIQTINFQPTNCELVDRKLNINGRINFSRVCAGSNRNLKFHLKNKQIKVQMFRILRNHEYWAILSHRCGLYPSEGPLKLDRNYTFLGWLLNNNLEWF